MTTEKNVEIDFEKIKTAGSVRAMQAPLLRRATVPKSAETEYTPNEMSATNFNLYCAKKVLRGAQALAAISPQMPRYPLYRRMGRRAPEPVWTGEENPTPTE